MKKLLYILPEYDEKAHTHFSYLPPFIDALGKHLDITLIVERGRKPKLENVKRVLLMRPRIFRFIFLPLSILGARLRGATVCYVHYSFGAAFIASLIFRLSGGTVYYWNCGLPWQYSRTLERSLFEALVYQMVNYVVTGTEKLADHYAEEYNLRRAKVLVMPNWIELKSADAIRASADRSAFRKMLGVYEEQKVILFAHRLSERKGAHYLIDIAKKIPDNAILVVLGEGPLMPKLMHEAKNGKLHSKIRFFGWKPHDEVMQAIAASDMFIMPSDEEGFPHVLLETMALKIPFVAFAVGGVPEIVPPGLKHALVDKGNVDEFVRAIAMVLLTSRTEIELKTTETRKWMEQYDRGVVLKRFLKMTSLS